MRFLIVQSPDPREVNKYFDADIMPTIGKILSRSNKRYRLIDIELYQRQGRDGEERSVRGLLQRLN